MKVRDIMTANPSCCMPDSSLQEAAKLMRDNDCGCVPVCEDGKKPVGVITDRDVTCRVVAEGRDPRQLKAKDIMSTPIQAVSPDTDVDQCAALMEQNRIRRVVVVENGGACCGMVAQADLARHLSEHQVAEVVKEVSQPV
jgi:CBS domain-containing protein